MQVKRTLQFCTHKLDFIALEGATRCVADWPVACARGYCYISVCIPFRQDYGATSAHGRFCWVFRLWWELSLVVLAGSFRCRAFIRFCGCVVLPRASARRLLLDFSIMVGTFFSCFGGLLCFQAGKRLLPRFYLFFCNSSVLAVGLEGSTPSGS